MYLIEFEVFDHLKQLAYETLLNPPNVMFIMMLYGFSSCNKRPDFFFYISVFYIFDCCSAVVLAHTQDNCITFRLNHRMEQGLIFA